MSTHTIEEETDRRKDKGRRCCLGDGIECRTSQLAARIFEETLLEENPLWEGGGLVWCEPDDYPFSEVPILPSVRSSIYPFLQIILVLNLL